MKYLLLLLFISCTETVTEKIYIECDCDIVGYDNVTFEEISREPTWQCEHNKVIFEGTHQTDIIKCVGQI